MDRDVRARWIASENELPGRERRFAALEQHERDRGVRLRHWGLADRELGLEIERPTFARRERCAFGERRPRAVVDEHQAAAAAVFDTRMLWRNPRRSEPDVAMRSTTDDDRCLTETRDHELGLGLLHAGGEFDGTQAND